MKPPILDVTHTVLDNGLTLLVLESHLMPIVTSTIWYHVGSAHEAAGQTGLSHFLEHLLFKGTPAYPKGQIDRITAMHGGHNNAGTIYDYTMYYFTFASDRWEAALDIEADRMRNCLFDPGEVEAERNVVLEEFKQQQDSPWGVLGERVEAALFPQPHPYHHNPIGLQADLEQVSHDAIRAYYQAHYAPNNATLIVVGDVQTNAVIDTVTRLFSPLMRGSATFDPVIPPRQPSGEQRLEVVQDTNVKRVEIGYHTAKMADRDNDALDVIDYILSHGKTCRFYRRFVERDQLVTFADTCNHPRKFDGVFQMFAELRPGISPGRFEQALQEEIDRLQNDLVDAAELQKVKNVVVVDSIFDLETTASLAQELGEYAVLDSYTSLNTYLERIQQITPEDVQRAAQTYFTSANRTVGWSFPEHPDQEALTMAAAEELDTAPHTEMVFHHPVGETHPFPTPGTSRPLAWAQTFSQNWQNGHFSRWVLDNGLTVLFLENHSLPIVAIEAYVENGQCYESEEKAGVAVLTGRLLEEGTQRRSAQEIAFAIESLGASMHARTQGVSAQALASDTEVILDIAADILRHPAFESEAFDRERGRLLASLDSDEDNPSLLAYNLFHEMVYGLHPYHRPRKGYRHTVQSLTRADVVEYYTRCFAPNTTILAIVGDLQADDVLTQAQRIFGDWPRQTAPISFAAEIPHPVGCTRKHLPRDKEQAHVFLGHPGITRSNPDFYTLLTLDHILGASAGFTDRISKRLRDEEGLAYTVYANIALSAEIEPGVFTAYIGTSPEHIEQALEGFLDEIRTIRSTPVSQEELAIAQGYLTGSYVLYFETGSQLAQYLIHTERFQLGQDFLLRYPQLINRVTPDDIRRAAQTYLDPENYYVAIVGATTE